MLKVINKYANMIVGNINPIFFIEYTVNINIITLFIKVNFEC